MVTMFNGKKEQMLEEKLQAVMKMQSSVMAALENQNSAIAVQIKKSAVSAAKIAGNLGQMEETITQVHDLSETAEEAASDIYGEIVRVNNVIESFDANHSILVGKLKTQNEKQQDIAKRRDAVAPLIDEAAGAPSRLSAGFSEIGNLVAQMLDFSKSMGVMALNAAIEAGRLGESGTRFIHAAEEIRVFSEQYEAAAREVAAQLDNCREIKLILEKQLDLIREELKEEATAERKVLNERLHDLADYEGAQQQLHGVMLEAMVGRSDALLQAEHEMVRLNSHLSLSVQNMRDELHEIEDSETELLDASKAASAAML